MGDTSVVVDDEEVKEITLDMEKDIGAKEDITCFLCEQNDAFAECIRSDPKIVSPINGKENDDQELDILREFDLKVRLVSALCEGCQLHLRLLSAKRVDAVEKTEHPFCHTKCAWTRIITRLPPIDGEPVENDPDPDLVDPNRQLIWIYDRVKNRLQHQALVELTSKSLPENILLPPIKSYDELSTFFKSRINLSHDEGLDSPTLGLDPVKKKRGRPKNSLNKPKEVFASTPVERMSRETSRLKELDCSYLEIIFRHPEGYSPHSILVTPERSLNRSSLQKSVSFSNKDTFFERLVFDDSDESEDSDRSRECSRSPGSPVPKRRKIVQEEHPNKQSPKKKPPLISTPTKKSEKNKADSTTSLKITKKDKNKTAKVEKSSKTKDSTTTIEVKLLKHKNKPSKKNNKPQQKAIHPTVTGIIKYTPLLHGKKKPDLMKSPPKRLLSAYLRKKFGLRFFSCRVKVSRKLFNGPLVFDEYHNALENIDPELPTTIPQNGDASQPDQMNIKNANNSLDEDSTRDSGKINVQRPPPSITSDDDCTELIHSSVVDSFKLDNSSINDTSSKCLKHDKCEPENTLATVMNKSD